MNSSFWPISTFKAFQTPELKILTDFKILALQNIELKFLADFKILAFENPEFKIWPISRF